MINLRRIIKKRWESLNADKLINYFPAENKKVNLKRDKIKLTVSYVPERGKRTINYEDKKTGSPFGGDLMQNARFIHSFGDMIMIANLRPATEYHALICASSPVPQNAFEVEDQILQVSEIVEKTGMRAFMNMMEGAAATVNQFHVQTLYEPFNIENLQFENVSENIGYLKNWGGNILFRGELDKRISLLSETVKRYRKNWRRKTVKSDGTESDPVFSLLFWEDKIVMFPRRKESPSEFKTMFGGMELGGTFIISDEKESGLERISYEKLIRAIEDVTFAQDKIMALIG